MRDIAAKTGEIYGPPVRHGIWPGAWDLGAADLHAALGSAICA